MTEITFGRGVLDGAACVSTAWELIKRRYGLYLGVTLLSMVLTTWLYCISWFVLGPIVAGVFYIVSCDLNDESIDFGMMFKGFDKFLPLMIIGLIQSIPQMLNQVLSLFFNAFSLLIPQDRDGNVQFFEPSISPSLAGGMVGIILLVAFGILVFFIVWGFVFYFAIPITFEFDLGPVEAIKLSARAAVANAGGIIVLAIMSILVGLLGMLLLCVGIFLVSVPVVTVAYAVAYRQVFPRIQENFNMAPPPPNAYGSNFGSGM